MSGPAGIPFGNYQLLRRLARGGMAEVFLARQRGLEGFHRVVAIKRILPHLVDNDDFVRMFLDEARLAARLSHPNVIHIYELGQVDEHYFIAMEFMPGVHAGDLIRHAASERLPDALVARIGADACAGLHYAHQLSDELGVPLSIVHRDVSPPNLLVSYDGVVKVVDFGIAKAASCVEQTRTGVVKGKYAYMSPEQTTGRKLDGRSDVFSLGLVLWELLAGRVAVTRDDQVAAMRMIRDGRVPDIREARPDLPDALAHTLSRALAVRADDRADARELGLLLEEYIKSCDQIASSMELGQWIRDRFPPQPLFEEEGGGKGTVQATQATRATAASAVAVPNLAPSTPSSGVGAAAVQSGMQWREPSASGFVASADAAVAAAMAADEAEEETRSLRTPPGLSALGGAGGYPGADYGAAYGGTPEDELATTEDRTPPPAIMGSAPYAPLPAQAETVVTPEPAYPLYTPPAQHHYGHPGAGTDRVAAPRRRRGLLMMLGVGLTLAAGGGLLVAASGGDDPPKEGSRLVAVVADAAPARSTAADPVEDEGDGETTGGGEDTAREEDGARAEAQREERERAAAEAKARKEAEAKARRERAERERAAAKRDRERKRQRAERERAERERAERERAERERAERERAERERAAREKPEPPAFGELKVRTRPYSVVYHRGKKLGVTPFAGVRLRAGRYKLTFKNPGLPPVTKVIEIQANETTKLDFEL